MIPSSTKDELAALRPVIDDEQLVRREIDRLVPLVVETLGTGRVTHAHVDVILSGRQHKALVDPRRTVAGNPRGREAGPIDIAAVDVELDIDRPAHPRTILHAAHVGWQPRDLFRREPSTLAPAIGAVHER